MTMPSNKDFEEVREWVNNRIHPKPFKRVFRYFFALYDARTKVAVPTKGDFENIRKWLDEGHYGITTAKVLRYLVTLVEATETEPEPEPEPEPELELELEPKWHWFTDSLGNHAWELCYEEKKPLARVYLEVRDNANINHIYMNNGRAFVSVEKMPAIIENGVPRVSEDAKARALYLYNQRRNCDRSALQR